MDPCAGAAVMIGLVFAILAVLYVLYVKPPYGGDNDRGGDSGLW